MECPNCEKELNCIDWYGFNMGTGREIKSGDIYKCLNEDCLSFEQHFYTRKGQLNEGYPC